MNTKPVALAVLLTNVFWLRTLWLRTSPVVSIVPPFRAFVAPSTIHSTMLAFLLLISTKPDAPRAVFRVGDALADTLTPTALLVPIILEFSQTKPDTKLSPNMDTFCTLLLVIYPLFTPTRPAIRDWALGVILLDTRTIDVVLVSIFTDIALLSFSSIPPLSFNVLSRDVRIAFALAGFTTKAFVTIPLFVPARIPNLVVSFWVTSTYRS